MKRAYTFARRVLQAIKKQIVMQKTKRTTVALQLKNMKEKWG